MRIYILFIALSLLPVSLCGEVLKDKTEIRYVQEVEPWLKSANPARLPIVGVANLFEVSLFANQAKGNWVNYNQSNNSFQTGASAESYYRYSPKVHLYGKIDYGFFSGKNMGGSYFIDSTQTPFDIVEYTDENKGGKKMENYQLKGGAGFELTPKLSIGADISYSAANYAKLKDLRHTNELMDMEIGAGVISQPFAALRLGLNYHYRRRVEGLTFGSYGQGDKIFQSLVSYGAFFGTLETFGENGYTKDYDDKPLIDEYHSSNLQANISFTDNIAFLNEFGYQWICGQYGVKSPSTVVYSEHNANVISYQGIFSVQHSSNRHQLKLAYRKKNLTNAENIYRYDNEEGGKIDVGYYGSIDVAEHKKQNTSIGYMIYWNEKRGLPEWVTRLDVEFISRNQTASKHPYYRIQNLYSTTIALLGERNLIKGKNRYNIQLGGCYRFGGGKSHIDGTYATPSSGQQPPQTINQFMLHEFEYLTANQAQGDISFQYSRILTKNGIRLFASIGYGITHSLLAEYIDGRNFHQTQIKIGCAF